MNTSLQLEKKGCCPKFDINKWDDKILDWYEKPFIKASVPALFHIPSSKALGKKITQLMKKAEEVNCISENEEDVLLLFHDPNPFRSDMYLSVEGAVSKAKNVKLSGEFITKVFDGPPHEMPKFIKEMNVHLENQNKKAKHYYVHYAYCPKCAKETGHNYMVLFAEL